MIFVADEMLSPLTVEFETLIQQTSFFGVLRGINNKSYIELLYILFPRACVFIMYSGTEGVRSIGSLFLFILQRLCM